VETKVLNARTRIERRAEPPVYRQQVTKALNRDLPFGGIKQSGINRYHGPTGLRLFTESKSMVIDDGMEDTAPSWFPYTEAKLAAARERFSIPLR